MTLSRAGEIAADELIRIFVAFQDALPPAVDACDSFIDAMVKVKSGELDDADVARMKKSLVHLSTLTLAAERMALIEPLIEVVKQDLS